MTRISLRKDSVARLGKIIPAGTPFEVSDADLARFKAMYAHRLDEIVYHSERKRTEPTRRTSRERSAPILKKPFGSAVEKSDEPDTPTDDNTSDE